MAVKSIRNQENGCISKSTFLSGNYLHRVNSTLKLATADNFDRCIVSLLSVTKK